MLAYGSNNIGRIMKQIYSPFMQRTFYEQFSYFIHPQLSTLYDCTAIWNIYMPNGVENIFSIYGKILQSQSCQLSPKNFIIMAPGNWKTSDLKYAVRRPDFCNFLTLFYLRCRVYKMCTFVHSFRPQNRMCINIHIHFRNLPISMIMRHTLHGCK